MANASHLMLFNASQIGEFGLEKRQREPLIDEESDLEWAGTMTIGTPAQSFLIDFDSTFIHIFRSCSAHWSLFCCAAGSADLWVPGIACSSNTCKTKHKFTDGKSRTAKKQSGTFSIQYGDGSTVSGPVYTDTGMFCIVCPIFEVA